MKKQQQYIDDLRDIKDIMTRSSRFISLSGFSGILAGSIALLGAFLAYQKVYAGQDYFTYGKAEIDSDSLLSLLAMASIVLILSLLSGILLTIRKARKNKQSIWDAQSKRLVVNLLIPLVTGGILCLILLARGYIGIIAPLTLIFYGLALVNASKYTLSEIRGLGLIEICLGLIAAYFIGYGLLFWAIGFGVMHIVYGIMMHIKHGS
jgi:hypothetical protein